MLSSCEEVVAISTKFQFQQALLGRPFGRFVQKGHADSALLYVSHITVRREEGVGDKWIALPEYFKTNGYLGKRTPALRTCATHRTYLAPWLRDMDPAADVDLIATPNS